jgi:hypothetical protein
MVGWRNCSVKIKGGGGEVMSERLVTTIFGQPIATAIGTPDLTKICPLLCEVTVILSRVRGSLTNNSELWIG